jgi:hypothetical protein
MPPKKKAPAKKAATKKSVDGPQGPVYARGDKKKPPPRKALPIRKGKK